MDEPTKPPSATGSALSRVERAKAKFNDAHRKGMDALKRGDYDAMSHAVRIEQDAVDDLLGVIAEAPAPKPR